MVLLHLRNLPTAVATTSFADKPKNHVVFLVCVSALKESGYNNLCRVNKFVHVMSCDI